MPQQGQSAKREPPESADACLARFMCLRPPTPTRRHVITKWGDLLLPRSKIATDDTAMDPQLTIEMCVSVLSWSADLPAAVHVSYLRDP